MQQIRIQKQRTKQRQRHSGCDTEQATPTQPIADTTAAGELVTRIDELLADSES